MNRGPVKNNIFNPANCLSFLRILLTPVFIWLLLLDTMSSLTWALVVFSIAALTDSYDGYVARKLNVASEIGNFLDPIADKILLIGAFGAFWWMEMIPLWFLIIIIARDAVITKLRTVLLKHGTPLKTSMLGKVKTVCQFIVIYILFMYLFLLHSSATDFLLLSQAASIARGTVHLVAWLTLYSGINYFWRMRRETWEYFEGAISGNMKGKPKNVGPLIDMVSTVFFLGYAVPAPGTAASAVTAVVCFYLFPLSTHTIGMVVMGIFMVGLWASELYTQGSKDKDPSCIVIDEVLGMVMVLACTPHTPMWFLIGFLAFRVFDIVKVFPVNFIDRHAPGGLGVMLDDVAAALYAILVVQILSAWH